MRADLVGRNRALPQPGLALEARGGRLEWYIQLCEALSHI